MAVWLGPAATDAAAQRIQVQSTTSAVEGSAVEFTMRLWAASLVTSDVVLSCSTGDDDTTGANQATAGTDYTAVTGTTVTIASDADRATVTVQTATDSVSEGDETFKLTCTGTTLPSNVTIQTPSAVGRIVDAGAATVSIEPASATEGSPVNFKVRLSEANAAITRVILVTADDTSGARQATAGTDYKARVSTWAILAGETEATFPVTTHPDTDAEGDETFLVHLGERFGSEALPPGVVIGTPRAVVGTILDDDGTTVSIEAASATEGSALSFTVRLSKAAGSDVVLGWSTGDDGTEGANQATADTDYTAVTGGSVTIATGSTTATLTVQTADDSATEVDETLKVTITGTTLPAGVFMRTTTAVGTIVDDDAATVSVEGASATEGSALSFTVRLSNTAGSDLVLGWSTGDDPAGAYQATADTDYTAVTGGSVTIASGSTTATLTVQTTADSVGEGDETFQVTITGTTLPAGVTIATATAVGTIVDDDDSVRVSVEPASATEGSALSFTVRLSKAANSNVVLGWSTGDDGTEGAGQATAGTDYTAVTTGSVTIAAGSTTATLTVQTTGDTDVEGDETFQVTITGTTLPAEVFLGTATAVGTILDDDAVTVSIEAASATEASALSFTVRLSKAANSNVVLGWSTGDDDTAGAHQATAGTDYTAVTGGSVTITSGSTTATLTVQTADDSALEGDETLQVTITGTTLPAGVFLRTTTAVGTIVDADAATVSVEPASATEGSALSFTVRLSKTAGSDVVLGWSTGADGTAGAHQATANTDYTAVTGGSVTIASGSTTATLTVQTTADSVGERDETFQVTITGTTLPSGVTIATATAVGTILDDDGVHVSVEGGSATEGSPVTFKLKLSKGLSSRMTLSMTTSDDDTPGARQATAGTDYTTRNLSLWTIEAGSTEVEKEVKTRTDTDVEGDETFKVTVRERPCCPLPTGVFITTATAVGTILDDGAVMVHVEPASATEGSALSFTVRLTKAASSDVVLGWSTGDDADGAHRATAGTDYTAVTGGSVTIATGSTTATLTVQTTAETDIELDESFKVTITGTTLPAGVFMGTTTAVGTIVDDDGVHVSVGAASAAEGSALLFWLSLSKAAGSDVVLGWSTGDDETEGAYQATAGTDYTAVTGGSVTIASGSTTASLSVATADDDRGEGEETLKVTISGTTLPEGVRIVTDSALGTIRDDDGVGVDRDPDVPVIDLVKIVSAPTYDADDDGQPDTYVRGDKILVDVGFTRPVTISGTIKLRLDLGSDDSTLSNSQREIELDSTGVLHGGVTLRFSYEVQEADVDGDGLWVQTTPSNKVLVLTNGSTRDAHWGVAADVTRSDLPTAGDPNAKVNGGKTSADTGPLPASATVNGANLDVTFDRALNTSVDTAALPFNFAVQGAGGPDGNRNAYQHPSAVSWQGTSGTVLRLKLSMPARSGDKVTLSYELYDADGTLEGAGENGKAAPAFVGLGVTNNSSGTVRPVPRRAMALGWNLRLFFDRPLKEDSRPAGSAFTVMATNLDDDLRAIKGTTVYVDGKKVTLELAAELSEDELASVDYTKPDSSPLLGADGRAVRSFRGFKVGEFIDAVAPVPQGVAAMQTSTDPPQSKVVVYFHEPLASDTYSLPPPDSFTVTVGSGFAEKATSVAIVNHAVELMVPVAAPVGATVTVEYTRPGQNSNNLMGLSGGNWVESFEESVSAKASGKKPELVTSRVLGSQLRLHYLVPLDPGAVPDTGAFTVFDGTGDERREYEIVGVSVESHRFVLLRLAHPVHPCAPHLPFKVKYEQPTDEAKRLKSVDGMQADSVNEDPAVQERVLWCVDGEVRRTLEVVGGKAQKSLLRFGRTLDTHRALKPSLFRLAGQSGGAAPSVVGAAYANNARGVVLTLDRALRSGETATLSYTRPEREAGLWDTEGNQIADFSGVRAVGREASAAATGVEVVSDPGGDDTYGLGDVIRVRVAFNEAVEVEGEPRLRIDMDPADWGKKWAVYESGSGTDELTFAYRVAKPNESEGGIAVLADTLELNGGTIRSASAGTDAELGHDGLDHDPAHKVDWRLAPAGTASVTGVEVVSDAGEDDTYALGDRIRVRVTFSDAVEVDTADGAPRLRIDMDPASHWGAKWAVYEGGDGTESLTFAYEVVEPNESTQGIAVLADTLEENGGAIRSASTGTDAHLSHTGLGHDPAHKVDWRLAPAGNVPATGAPAIAGTAQVGETLSASTADIEDADGLSGATFAFQWVSSADGSDTDISGATGRSYTLADSDVGATIKVRASFTDDAGNREELTSAPTERVEPRTLTAEFEGMPAEHDGVHLFNFDLVFSENFPGRFPYTTLRDSAFTVTNGRVRGAERVVKGENRRWRLTVRPSSNDDLTITLAAGAVSTESGRPLANTVSATVAGPVGVSVADARVKEAAGAALAFAVTLSRTATTAFSVDYATSDGTAQAGADYTAASGTLSFQPGDSSATIEVAVLDDAHDEGEETLTLRLSNASGAWLSDGEATGTIENADLMPAALLARFGRATAEHVVTHIEERIAAPRQRGFRARFAGRELQPGSERDFALGFLQQFAQPGMGPAGAALMGGPGMGGGVPMGMGSQPVGGALGAPGAGMPGMGGGSMGGMPGAVGTASPHAPMGGASAMAGHGSPGTGHENSLFSTMLGHDPLANSEFELNRESRGGILSVWSRSSRSNFSGIEDALSLNGEVRTTMFGADWARGPLTVGLSVGRTLGMGGYRGPSGGQMTTSMTGFYPWVGYQVNDRVSVWGTTGYGTGALSLTPDGQSALETGVSMMMSAVGTRGELVGSRATGGFALAFKADTLWVGAASDLLDGPTGRLNASEAGVTRVRTALEGSRGFTLAGSRLSLTPSVEVGLRRDGGDAETGVGMDVGGGLAFTDTVTGLSLDVRVRTLVMHQAEGFSDRGVSLSLGWDPTPSSPLGLTARVAPSWGGQAQGGAEALWGNQMAYGMGSHQMHGSGERVDAEVGYGLPVGARFVGTPKVGISTSTHGRDYRFGYGLGVLEQGKLNFELAAEAQRREIPLQGEASNGFVGRATLGW